MPDLEPFARRVMQKLDRNPDDWPLLWNLAREFIAMAEAWDELRADPHGLVAAATEAARRVEDGWTWNERLGWIGPDGKPADPRRRG